MNFYICSSQDSLNPTCKGLMILIWLEIRDCSCYIDVLSTVPLLQIRKENPLVKPSTSNMLAVTPSV